jgi:hypothetical protein
MTGLALTFYAFVVVIVLADRMWKKLPADHPAVVARLKNLISEVAS